MSRAEPSRSRVDLNAAQQQLIARIRRSDTAALAELYDATSAQIFGVILRVAGDRTAAEEITIDMFKQVWTQAGKFDSVRYIANRVLGTKVEFRIGVKDAGGNILCVGPPDS